jgi:excisionase family DNA binding protein
MDTSNNTQTRLLYDRKGAALQLSISVRTLDYIIAAKGLQTRRIGKKVLIPYTSLKAYAAGNHYDAVTSLSDADAVASGDKCA